MKTASRTNSREEAWQIVAARALQSLSYEPFFWEEGPHNATANTATSITNHVLTTYQMPLKKRPRVVVPSDSSQSSDDDEGPTAERPEQALVSHSADDGVTARSAKFPHLLPLYQDTYNQNGHVGIYNPKQRAAILKRFHEKRLARKWNKKIRYDCRKNLADKRVRVKGRFVKGLVYANIQDQASLVKEEDMPDTTDVEAGFDPIDGHPFRRARRVTDA